MDSVLLTLHIIGAAAWLGGNLTQFVVNRRFEDGAPAAAYLRATVAMGRVLYTPAAVLLLITGVWMVIRSPAFGFGSVFVTIGFAMVIVGGALGGVVFGPNGRKAADLHDAGSFEQAHATSAIITRFGAIDTLLLLVTVTAMVNRWGA